MTLFFTGFDELSADTALSQQMPTLQPINDGFSIVNGRNNDGRALRATSGAYLQYILPTTSSSRTVAIGAAFKYANTSSNNIIIQVLNSADLHISTDHEASSSTPEFIVLYVNDGFLWLKSFGKKEQLIRFPENEYAYIEVRISWKYRPDYNRDPKTEIFCNGLKIRDLGALGGVSSSRVMTAVYLASAPDGMTIDTDNVYIETWDTARRSATPILASGKISSLALTTISNTFNVVGESASAAVSDNSDGTYISSVQTAEAIFNIDNNVPDIYALQVSARAKSDTAGVTTFTIKDDANTDICPEQNIGFSSALSTNVVTSISSSNPAVITDKIKSGATLRIKT